MVATLMHLGLDKHCPNFVCPHKTEAEDEDAATQEDQYRVWKVSLTICTN